MENNLIKMKKLDLITEFTGSWGKDARKFLDPFFENSEIISLSKDLFLSKSEFPGGFIFLIRKEVYEQNGSDFASLENLFDFMVSNHATGMEIELKKVVNERSKNGTLYTTEVNRDDLISLNQISNIVFKKLTLNDWLSENFLVSKIISRIVFSLVVVILIFVAMYLIILSSAFIYGVTNFIAGLCDIVIVLFLIAAIKALLQFKNDNHESFLKIQKKLIECIAYDDRELKDLLFRFVEDECENLNKNDSSMFMRVHFGEEKISELYQSLFHETITESIILVSSPFYHFEKLKSKRYL